MKKWFRRTVAIVLTAAMVISVGMPAFADEQEENTVFVSETEKQNVSVEEIYSAATATGSEELMLVGGTAYYYRLIDGDMIYVIAESDTVRNTVIYDKTSPSNIYYNEKPLSEVTCNMALIPKNSLAHYRELLKESNLQSLEFETRMLSKQVRTIPTAEKNAVYAKMDAIGHNMNGGYDYRSIYTTTIGKTKVDLFEKMEYTMSRAVAENFGFGDALSLVWGIFTIDLKDLMVIVDVIDIGSGIYQLASACTIAEYNIFQRTYRDARINSIGYYDAGKTTKWTCYVGTTDVTKSTVPEEQYTNYTSELFNDKYGMCERAANYYN